MSEETDKTLKDEVKELNSNVKKLLESDKSKIIKPKKLSRGDKKKGKIRVIYLNENKDIKVIKVPIEEGTALIEGCPRLATPDYMMTWQGDPTIILPGWSTKPFSPSENLDQTTKDNMNAVGFRLLANRVELGAVKGKKSMPGWLIFVGIIGLIVVGYLLLK